MADEWETITPNTGEEKEVVEFEIEGEEDTTVAAPEIEVEEKVEQPVVEAEPEDTEDTEEKEEKAEEEQALEGVETSGAQKRIRQLVKQKKEREEEITKLLEQNKQMQVALQQQQEEYRGAVGTNLANSEAQIVERLAVARDSYKRAIDSGDSDLILKAQEYLNNAQLDSTRIQDAKRQFEALTPAQQQQVETQAQAQAAQEPETYQGYDLKAYQWASKNEWFNSDPVLTNAALAIDAQLKDEGFDPREDDFYLEIDKRLAQTFPTKFDGAPAPVGQTPRSKATSQPSQVVAGASSAPKASSGKKVKLSQEDVRLAQKWGITLEQYAAEKLKIERVNEGEYTTVG